MLQRVLIDETIEVLFQLAGDCGRSPGAWAIPQALGPLLRKALHPCAEGGIGQMERRGDGIDMVAGHDLPDRLRAAKDPRFLGLLDSIGIPILRLPSRPHDTKARWGEEGTCCGPMMGWM